MKADNNYKKLIHTMRWLRLRKLALQRHPLCQRCEENGVMTFATEVHHVIPCETAINGAAMEALMFDLNNLRCICHDCHVQSHIEMGRSGKEANKRLNEARLDSIKKKFFDDAGL